MLQYMPDPVVMFLAAFVTYLIRHGIIEPLTTKFWGVFGELAIHVNLSILPFPEDYIANLALLKNRMEKKRVANWQIKLRLLSEIVSLFFAFYIRIPITNRILSSDKADDYQIDD